MSRDKGAFVAENRNVVRGWSSFACVRLAKVIQACVRGTEACRGKLSKDAYQLCVSVKKRPRETSVIRSSPKQGGDEMRVRRCVVCTE